MSLTASLGIPALRAAPEALADDIVPAAHLQVIVKDVHIYDDRDLIGSGEMHMVVGIWECNAGAQPPCYYEGNFQDWRTLDPIIENRAQGIARAELDFSSDSDEDHAPNRLIPSTEDERFRLDVTEEQGFTIYAGRHYVLAFKMWELDDTISDTVLFQPDYMGEVFQLMDTDEHGLGLGTHKERSYNEEAYNPGDYQITYEIRPAPLPDLAVTILNRDEGIQHYICAEVQNIGDKPSQPFYLTIRSDGARIREQDPHFPGLDVNASLEHCVLRSEMSPAEHMLSFRVDQPALVAERDLSNNFYEQRVEAIGAQDGGHPSVVGTGPGPLVSNPPATAAAADLVVKSVQINGKTPSGKNDCDAGKNDVTVVVGNAGTTSATSFAVQLGIEDEADVPEKTVAGLDIGKEAEVAFNDVQFKKGEHHLTVNADTRGAIAEANENNNEMKITVRCKDDN
jgi:CARDB protein